VRIAGAEQPELHAEPTGLDPTHHGGQPHVGVGVRQAQHDANLQTELHLTRRLDEHATDADVLGAPADAGAAAHLAGDVCVEGDSWMSAFVLHDDLGGG